MRSCAWRCAAVILFLALVPVGSNAADLSVGFTADGSLIWLRDKTSLNYSGEFDGGGALSPFVSVATEEQYFGDTNFGYMFSATWRTFSADGQICPGVGGRTSCFPGSWIKGNYMYVLPSVFRRWGDRYMQANGHTFTIGAAFGVGYMTADGFAHLQPSYYTTAPVAGPPPPDQIVAFSSHGPTRVMGIYFEGSLSLWFWRLEIINSDLELTARNTNTGASSPHKLSITGTTWTLGRKFEF